VALISPCTLLKGNLHWKVVPELTWWEASEPWGLLLPELPDYVFPRAFQHPCFATGHCKVSLERKLAFSGQLAIDQVTLVQISILSLHGPAARQFPVDELIFVHLAISKLCFASAVRPAVGRLTFVRSFLCY
jgi:hypothetical protein